MIARAPDSFGAYFSSGALREALRTTEPALERYRAERMVMIEAYMLTIQSRIHAVLGEFDAADAVQADAMALLPRLAPESNAVFQVFATPMLQDTLCGIGTRALCHRSAACVRGAAGHQVGRPRDSASPRPRLSRSPAKTRAPGSCSTPRSPRSSGPHRGHPTRRSSSPARRNTAWILERTEHLAALERNVREKWLEPDVCYPGFDSRWSYALLCALDGRPDDARHWFAESRRVLLEQESEPMIVGVDHDAALMELRLGADGDPARFAECIAAARARCTHPAMAPGSPASTQLEAQAAATF